MAIYNPNESNLCRGKLGEINNKGKIEIDKQIQYEWMECEPVLGDVCKKCKYYAICHGNVTCPYSSKFQDKEKQTLCKRKIYEHFIPAETLMQHMLGRIDTII